MKTDAWKNLRSRWGGMMDRCYNPKSDSYKYYGARGITVCEEWRTSFEAYFRWATTSGFSPELTIDREDNDGNYEPGNCRWVTRKVSMNNKRHRPIHPSRVNCKPCTVAVSIDTARSLKELSVKLGMSRCAIALRCIRVGLDTLKSNPARFIAA